MFKVAEEIGNSLKKRLIFILTKYAANAMLATKISFINEIANICEKVGADINNVRKGVGSDSRIGFDFIYPGIGFGGSCFPKDLRSIQNFSKEAGYDTQIINSVINVKNTKSTKVIGIEDYTLNQGLNNNKTK